MTPDSTLPLSLQLKQQTAHKHEQMHRLMERAEPFSSRAQYARFVAAQYVFQRDVEALFALREIQTAIPDLETRGRVSAARNDLRDLDFVIPEMPLAEHITMPAALGWLYVSEGSTLGAAFLLKEVKKKLALSESFGARNLAAYPEGRAIVWQRFTRYLDEARLDEQGKAAEVIAGAHAAFNRFDNLLRHFFQLA
ncbi:biliverdin-producing heme oxygenase [Oxalicibacterium faecigallinarum]|uniref:Heme oxygenase n=1 Tax=Oxalicibacterium faecigallinarum TaxID=573741 RepID=A0A8J3ARR1_9BURK|nr:biliverdin-producing heme oxygenase [Oxalicibacterium faecigallinarum]GGI17580.1 heme oxygenase [Oxalicibacterium faecigallinarum]